MSLLKEYPEPIVGIFCLSKDERKILLAKSYKFKNKWVPPGGHIELGESIEKAVRREAFEEVGLKVRKQKVFQIQESIFSPTFHKKRHHIYLEVVCSVSSEKVKLDNDELQEFKWVSLSEALKMNLEASTRKSIKKLIELKKEEYSSDLK